MVASTRTQVEYDARRSEVLTKSGFHVIRFWNSDVLQKIDDVLAKFSGTCKRHPSPRPSPASGRGVKAVALSILIPLRPSVTMSALDLRFARYLPNTIMVFQDQFKNHILPDKVHILNVAFLVPRMRKEFGGCAGNISYNLKLLGGHPVPMGTVGQDFGPYREHFTK